MEKIQNHENLYANFLYYLAKFWGFAPFTWTNNRAYIGSWNELLYSSILVFLCVPQVLIGVSSLIKVEYPGKTTMTSVADSFSTHLGDLGGGLCLILVASKRRKLVRIINTLYKVDDMLADLGVDRNYEKSTKTRAIVVGLWSASILITLYGGMIVYCQTMGLLTTLWVAYAFVIGTFIHSLHHHVDLCFVIAMDVVRKRYEQLNDRLMHICEPESMVRYDRDRRDLSTNWTTLNVASAAEENRNHSGPGSEKILKPSEKLKKIAELAEVLHEVTDSVVEVASLPVIVTISYHFTLLLNMIYHLFATTTIAIGMNDGLLAASIVVTGFWTIGILCELFAIAAISSLTQETANSTAAILHKIWHRYHSSELKDEIQMLSLQLLQRPLTISAFGFFSLDYSYLYKIFCAVVAYFIIMIQLDTSRLEPGHITSTLNSTHVQ